MNKATDPVLELLDEVGIAITPGAIIFELDRGDGPSRRTILRSIDALEERDYVVRPKGENTTLLKITDRGREYLQGQRDAGEDK